MEWGMVNHEILVEYAYKRIWIGPHTAITVDGTWDMLISKTQKKKKRSKDYILTWIFQKLLAIQGRQ